MKIKIPENVKKIISTLENEGYETYIVGGCVRDALRGVRPVDWDLCTKAIPSEMKKTLKNFKLIETGVKHGTMTVVLTKKNYEITTFRLDGKYSDNRHPDNICFTENIKEDLKRRDFTINAMAYNEGYGLVDTFGGRKDLDKGIIKAVGNSDKRFEEDALRILRGGRFAAQFGFDIEDETFISMINKRHLLANVSAERIQVEFVKWLCGKAAGKTLNLCRKIIGEIIPEIIPSFGCNQQNGFHVHDVWLHTVGVIDSIPAEPILRLAAFFHDIGKPKCKIVTEEGWNHFYGHEKKSAEITEKILTRLKLDNEIKKTVIELIDFHRIVFNPEGKQARRLLNRLGQVQLARLIDFEKADVKNQNPKYINERIKNIERFQETVLKVIEEGQCFSMKDLALNGDDILEMGVPQGEKVGKILEELLEKVIDGELENKKEILIKKINI